MHSADYPITPLLPRIRASLAAHPRLLLQAPPGAGKTTQVPPALLNEAWLAGRRLVMLEPRRVAARAAAEFMAAQRGEPVGGTIGYRIRFESRESAATRILVVTEGILARMLQDDPGLEDIGAIVFDEFHERHLAGDLGAALALDVQDSLRPELRLLVMSATLEGARMAGWLQAPVLASDGRAFPVRIEYPPATRGDTPASRLRRAVRRALDETSGDVLVFLPGRREIAQAAATLGDLGNRGMADATRRLELLPLHGERSLAEQRAALAPAEDGTRRVILATNLAESSVTVPGVRAVVDTGLAREPRFDPNSGLSRLATVNISQASADQRAGRAGRVAPGIAYRLWPESRRLEAARTPEIVQADLAGLALELAAWGVGADAAGALRWLDLPPAGALAQARELLQRLGALDEDLRITSVGRRMLALGAHPRLAAAALRTPQEFRPLAADLLALLESRSPLRGDHDDLRSQVDALHRFRDGGARSARDADAQALASIERTAHGWRKRLGLRHGASGTPDALAVGNLLLHAFPDRVARQQGNEPRRYRLANGRGARLHEASKLFGEPWLVVAEARFDARDSLVLAAAPFDPALLEREYPGRIVRERVVDTNAGGTVEVREQRRFDAIVLEIRSMPIDARDTLPALLAGVRRRGIDALPWGEAARRLRARIGWLRRALPEPELPDVSDQALLDSLDGWLAPALDGKRKLDALSAGELHAAFAALLDWPQRQRLDELAPEALTVPSGRSQRLDYGVDLQDEGEPTPPVLAVKLQELYGLAESPRIAGGRVAVMLHLLSPAGRPIQVTRDLRGFWERTYPEIRKELKGRYPKHPWPEDPWSATPTHRTRRRP